MSDETQATIGCNYESACGKVACREADPVRDNWSDGKHIRVVLERLRPLGLLDDYELIELEYVAARIDMLDEERYGADMVGEV